MIVYYKGRQCNNIYLACFPKFVKVTFLLAKDSAKVFFFTSAVTSTDNHYCCCSVVPVVVNVADGGGDAVVAMSAICSEGFA